MMQCTVSTLQSCYVSNTMIKCMQQVHHTNSPTDIQTNKQTTDRLNAIISSLTTDLNNRITVKLTLLAAAQTDIIYLSVTTNTMTAST
jgi:hypothetical protein